MASGKPGAVQVLRAGHFEPCFELLDQRGASALQKSWCELGGVMDLLELLFENDGLSAGGVLAAVVAALITYVFNAHLDRLARRRAARLQFVQDQLRLLYGPLYAITRANETIYALRAGSGSFQRLSAKQPAYARDQALAAVQSA
jgi:hypothetical protein